MATSGISSAFALLSRTQGQVTYALLTRAPLYSPDRSWAFSFDLHVLGTPPALILSQDQTLQLNSNASCEALFVLKILLGPCESESRRNCLCLPSFQRATPTLGDQTRIPNYRRAVNPFFWPLRRRVRLGGRSVRCASATLTAPGVTPPAEGDTTKRGAPCQALS